MLELLRRDLDFFDFGVLEEWRSTNGGGPDEPAGVGEPADGAVDAWSGLLGTAGRPVVRGLLHGPFDGLRGCELCELPDFFECFDLDFFDFAAFEVAFDVAFEVAFEADFDFLWCGLEVGEIGISENCGLKVKLEKCACSSKESFFQPLQQIILSKR